MRRLGRGSLAVVARSRVTSRRTTLRSSPTTPHCASPARNRSGSCSTRKSRCKTKTRHLVARNRLKTTKLKVSDTARVFCVFVKTIIVVFFSRRRSAVHVESNAGRRHAPVSGARRNDESGSASDDERTTRSGAGARARTAAR